ncbi:DUF6086 family protein [Streptomyces sp. NPDC001678]|uniref:DUF6086 family protein n=1 Tax=Streptomyces sp. NPDC001678 TaxID=3364599 RepID=UPI00367FC260
MSCYFQVNDEDVWNPSNSVAQIFLGQADTLSRSVGEQSGLGPVIEDECEINLPQFVKFTNILVKAYQDSNNRPFRSLLDGVIAISLVLIERGGGAVDSITPEYADMWAELRANHARSMPTG